MFLFMLLSRLFFVTFFLLMFGLISYLTWTRILRPIVFSENTNEKLTNATEDYLDSEVNKAAETIRKGNNETN